MIGIIAALAVGLTAAFFSSADSAHAAPAASAAAKRCGTFVHRYEYTVSRSGRVTCRTAMRIVKSFVKNHEGWKQHGDGTLASTYWTNRRYPGWRCAQGSGGGGCRKGKRVAAYENRLID